MRTHRTAAAATPSKTPTPRSSRGRLAGDQSGPGRQSAGQNDPAGRHQWHGRLPGEQHRADGRCAIDWPPSNWAPSPSRSGRSAASRVGAGGCGQLRGGARPASRRTRGAGIGLRRSRPPDRPPAHHDRSAGASHLQYPGRSDQRRLSPEQHRDPAVDQSAGNTYTGTRRTARRRPRPAPYGTTIPAGRPPRFPAQVSWRPSTPIRQYAPASRSPPPTRCSWSSPSAAPTAARPTSTASPWPTWAPPDTAGIVLTANIPGFATSTPSMAPIRRFDGVAVHRAVCPAQGQFNPNATLQVRQPIPPIRGSVRPASLIDHAHDDRGAAHRADLRHLQRPAAGPGTPVVISVSAAPRAPRTEVNNGAPTATSSSATSFPLN